MKKETKAFRLRDIHFEVLEAVRRYWQTHGYSPSLRDLSEMTRIRSRSHLGTLLDELEIKGYIRRQAEIARSIVLVRLPAKKYPGQKSGADDQERISVPPGTL
ncbi:MAG: LexA family protein [Anaerolineaceae bacterium]|jgi:SOS-response transcriptional repressor LexA